VCGSDCAAECTGSQRRTPAFASWRHRLLLRAALPRFSPFKYASRARCIVHRPVVNTLTACQQPTEPSACNPPLHPRHTARTTRSPLLPHLLIFPICGNTRDNPRLFTRSCCIVPSASVPPSYPFPAEPDAEALAWTPDVARIGRVRARRFCAHGGRRPVPDAAVRPLFQLRCCCAPCCTRCRLRLRRRKG
jgi:hypothetical protein